MIFAALDLGNEIFSFLKDANFPILKQLKTEDFDLIITDLSLMETMAASYLDKPIMSQIFYLPAMKLA
jgi:hypothetical protein